MITKLVILFTLTMSVAQAADLRVLNWNTYMLPWPIKDSNQKIRTPVIAEALKGEDYDFVFMEEAFTGSFRDKVGKILKSEYPHQYYLGNYRILVPYFGSGVFVLSKHAFKVIDKVYYKKNCEASDCMAAKGAVLIESVLPSGRKIQIASTHLQSKEDAGPIRLEQMKQVKAMLDKNKKKGVPQFFIGDLNTDVTEPEFPKGLEIMGMNATQLTGAYDHTNVIDCYKKPTADKEWIDHMWVDKDTQLKDSSISVRPISYEYKGKLCNASDHYAIEGVFTFAD
ncbi:MAG: endonuclease/exonuclease/phosphatase family protein [Bacteriovoracaceae bacterium]